MWPSRDLCPKPPFGEASGVVLPNRGFLDTWEVGAESLRSFGNEKVLCLETRTVLEFQISEELLGSWEDPDVSSVTSSCPGCAVRAGHEHARGCACVCV